MKHVSQPYLILRTPLRLPKRQRHLHERNSPDHVLTLITPTTFQVPVQHTPRLWGTQSSTVQDFKISRTWKEQAEKRQMHISLWFCSFPSSLACCTVWEGRDFLFGYDSMVTVYDCLVEISYCVLLFAFSFTYLNQTSSYCKGPGRR